MTDNCRISDSNTGKQWMKMGFLEARFEQVDINAMGGWFTS